MELEEERLISEVLWWSRATKHFPWEPWPAEIATLKSRLRKIWNGGDYDRVSRYTQIEAEGFYRRLAVPPGSRLLDIACGSGQLALIAARNGVDATGIDIAENLIDRARERARVEGLSARFYEADAEDLPFDDATFDVVTSVAGAMFAPRPEVAAKELLRVCRRGGIVAMANWTPQGFIGQMYRLISNFVAPSGMREPVLWGDEAEVRVLFGSGVSSVEFARRNAVLNFPFPPGEVVRFFRLYHGPVNRAFASLNRAGRLSLQAEMEELWSTHNVAQGGFTKVDAEWLELVARRTRRGGAIHDLGLRAKRPRGPAG
jgi:SAM-dependent methyltransferase